MNADQLKLKLSLLRKKRDRQIAAAKQQYKVAAQPIEDALKAELKARPVKRSAIDRYTETDDLPTRHCAGCGGELLKATIENAARLNTVFEFVQVRDGRKHAMSEREVTWKDVRHLRREHCCYWCKKQPDAGRHAYMCSRVDYVTECEAGMNSSEVTA